MSYRPEQMGQFDPHGPLVKHTERRNWFRDFEPDPRALSGTAPLACESRRQRRRSQTRERGRGRTGVGSPGGASGSPRRAD
jgi:hypothetical protein